MHTTPTITPIIIGVLLLAAAEAAVTGKELAFVILKGPIYTGNKNILLFCCILNITAVASSAVYPVISKTAITLPYVRLTSLRRTRGISSGVRGY